MVAVCVSASFQYSALNPASCQHHHAGEMEKVAQKSPAMAFDVVIRHLISGKIQVRSETSDDSRKNRKRIIRVERWSYSIRYFAIKMMHKYLLQNKRINEFCTLLRVLQK